MELYPFLFKLDGMTQPYLWGGEKLQALGKPGKAEEPLAEVWEIADRPEDDRVSIVANGPLAGTRISELVTNHSNDLLGSVPALNGRFPLLIKLLDAKQRLSLQVHPPRTVAAALGGEPKTECWYILDGTDDRARVIAGLKRGVSREQFETAIASGHLEPLLHSLPVKPGDTMLLPSGRLHAIDAGCLLLEVQQNSNTTYRVFDWNRTDPTTSQPRELHIEKALASINFDDTEPSLELPAQEHNAELLVDCPYFTLERHIGVAEMAHQTQDSFAVITVLNGTPELRWDGGSLPLQTLQCALIPASLGEYHLVAPGTTSYIRTYVRTA